MDYTLEVKTYLELHSSHSNPKSIRAIAEALTIPEVEAGIAIHNLIQNRVVKVNETGSSEGLLYYI